MADQEPVSSIPRWRWPRFRVRTMLLTIVVLGLVFGAVVGFPWLLWRYHVNQALEAARTAGPETAWSFNATQAPRLDEFLYLLSDRERVLESLLQTVEHDLDDLRRIHALQTMRMVLRQPGPFGTGKSALDRVLAITSRSSLSPGVESELARFIAARSSATGLDPTQRAVILGKAKSASPEHLPAWASVLAEIGGREETRFLISAGGTHDSELLRAIHDSRMVRSYWPGLLPALKRWLDDPEVAPRVLRYSLLSHTPEGRGILLAYAGSATNPVALRQQAVRELLETIPGTNLLLNSIEDQGIAVVLGAITEGDPRAAFRAALIKLEQRNGGALWSELIDGVGTGHSDRLPTAATAVEKAVSTAEGELQQRTRESSLRCLRWITGRTDIESQEAWRNWYESTRPSPLTQRELVTLALEHPEALKSAAIHRRIVPYQLGDVPADCLPLYERMAREGPPSSRYWACMALLLCTPRTDAAPVLIELIGERPAGKNMSGNWGPIELLKDRFAENFFWDTAAWRRWRAESGPTP